MAIIYRTPEYLKTKLYQREKEFKNFENITEEDFIRIENKIQVKEDVIQEKTKRPLDKLTKYMEILTYLTNPNIHLEFKTFDERILFLIMCEDPNLITFKEFLKTNIPSVQDVKREQNPKTREELEKKRVQEILELQTRVRDQIGFFDSKLLKFEKIYFQKFLSKQELISEVKQDNITALIALLPFINSFESISEEDFTLLQKKAQLWQAETNAVNDLYTAAYSCEYQSEILGLNNLSEKLAFLILAGDPELKCLKIYEEESKISEIERRCNEELNYYNELLIKLEKLFHEKFCPEKELSPWTLK